VDDEARVVEEDPLLPRVALHVGGTAPEPAQSVEDGVRDGDELALVLSREDEEEVGEVGGGAQVERDHLLGLLGEAGTGGRGDRVGQRHE
jgi:hypothetical protein